MKIINYFFYLCSRYILIGGINSEPSLLTGSAGLGSWFGLVTIAILKYIPCSSLHVLLSGTSQKVYISIIILINILLIFFYYKRRKRWIKVFCYYKQKKKKYEPLIFFIFTMIMFSIALVGIPFVLENIIKVVN